jgi:dinuclear metal center YbgI/SA1388 family protein
MTTGTDIINRFERYASPQLAESWDHVGVQVGNPNQTVTKLMTTLDVRPAVVDEAIKKGVDFIFAHHPVMFKPAKNLDTRDPQNAMYAKLLANQITVYAAHTNLDTANNGMNDWLAAQLGLTNCVPLVYAGNDPVSGCPVGMGRVGDLPQPLSVQDFARTCLGAFGVAGVRLVTPKDGPELISRVAILGGSGSEFYPQAQDSGAQAYVTGDVSYHTAHDIQASGLIVVDPGHHIEVIAAKKLAALLNTWKKEEQWDLTVEESQVNTEPFVFVTA